MTDSTPETTSSSELKQEIERQISEGLLPSTVERRLLREGYPEEEVKRLVQAERERVEEKRAKAQAQAMINTAKSFGLLLVVAGILLPWSSSAQADLFGTGGFPPIVLTGFSAQYLAYGLGFLVACLVLLVLTLLTRTHYDPTNTRDRVVFALTTFFEALLAAWWVVTLIVVNRDLAEARQNVLVTARFGAGIFIIPPGVILMLVVGYLEIAAVGGRRHITFERPGQDSPGSTGQQAR